MIHFTNVLGVGQTDLSLEATTQAEAVEQLLQLLRGDERVLDPDKLEEAVRERNAPAIEENGTAICIAHGRTDCLRGVVMAAGRLKEGVPVAGAQSPLRLVFVAGIPSALSAEYLRLVGAIARICSSKELLNKLLTVRDPARFIQLLENQLNPF